jgi:hypothetical protein
MKKAIKKTKKNKKKPKKASSIICFIGAVKLKSKFLP